MSLLSAITLAGIGAEQHRVVACVGQAVAEDMGIAVRLSGQRQRGGNNRDAGEQQEAAKRGLGMAANLEGADDRQDSQQRCLEAAHP